MAMSVKGTVNDIVMYPASVTHYRHRSMFKLLALPGEAAGEPHYGEAIREVSAASGRLVREGLVKTGGREKVLELRRKGDGVKVGLAMNDNRLLFITDLFIAIGSTTQFRASDFGLKATLPYGFPGSICGSRGRRVPFAPQRRRF
jgi:hypothetical protein